LIGQISIVEVMPLSSKTARTIEICLRGERHLLARREFDHELYMKEIGFPTSLIGTASHFGIRLMRRLPNAVSS
jgi:hypothetical protein